MRVGASVAITAICLEVAGCGAAPATGTANRGRAATEMPTCALNAQVMARAETIEIPGTRVRISMPYPQEMMLMRGLPLALHECGLAIFAVPAPLDGTGREFLDGALVGVFGGYRERGMSCEAEPSGAAWHCSSSEAVALVRRLGPPEDGALVGVQGAPADASALERIVQSAQYDPHAVFDPLAQMGIALELPEGMTMAPGAVAGDLRYEAPAPPGGFVADVRWAYVSYASLDAHDDGSEWTDREVGQVARQLIDNTGLESIDAQSMQLLSQSPEGLVTELAIEGVREGAAVLVYVRSNRDAAGVFYAIARIAAPEVAIWLPRVRAHTGSLRLSSP